MSDGTTQELKLPPRIVRLSIEIDAISDEALEAALAQVLEDFQAGARENLTGGYSFNISVAYVVLLAGGK